MCAKSAVEERPLTRHEVLALRRLRDMGPCPIGGQVFTAEVVLHLYNRGLVRSQGKDLPEKKRQLANWTGYIELTGHGRLILKGLEVATAPAPAPLTLAAPAAPSPEAAPPTLAAPPAAPPAAPDPTPDAWDEVVDAWGRRTWSRGDVRVVEVLPANAGAKGAPETTWSVASIERSSWTSWRHPSLEHAQEWGGRVLYGPDKWPEEARPR